MKLLFALTVFLCALLVHSQYTTDIALWNKLRSQLIVIVGRMRCAADRNKPFPYLCNSTLGSLMHLPLSPLRASWHRDAPQIYEQFAKYVPGSRFSFGPNLEQKLGEIRVQYEKFLLSLRPMAVGQRYYDSFIEKSQQQQQLGGGGAPLWSESIDRSLERFISKAKQGLVRKDLLTIDKNSLYTFPELQKEGLSHPWYDFDLYRGDQQFIQILPPKYAGFSNYTLDQLRISMDAVDWALIPIEPTNKWLDRELCYDYMNSLRDRIPSATTTVFDPQTMFNIANLPTAIAIAYKPRVDLFFANKIDYDRLKQTIQLQHFRGWSIGTFSFEDPQVRSMESRTMQVLRKSERNNVAVLFEGLTNTGEYRVTFTNDEEDAAQVMSVISERLLPPIVLTKSLANNPKMLLLSILSNMHLYLEKYGTVRSELPSYAYEAAFHHLVTAGIKQCKTPSLLYDPLYYRQMYKDELIGRRVQITQCEALLEDYLELGIEEGKNGSQLFHPKHYRDLYPDVKKLFVDTRNSWYDVILHYLTVGLYEGRIGSPHFDPKNYLNANWMLQYQYGEQNYVAAAIDFAKRL